MITKNELIKKLLSPNIIELSFQKKDKTMRNMSCTLNVAHIPANKRQHIKYYNNAEDYFTNNSVLVYDVVANDFRRVNFNSSLRIV